jgi:hypothetical protein
MSIDGRTFAVRGTESADTIARIMQRREEFRARRESFNAFAHVVYHIDLPALQRKVEAAARDEAEAMCQDLAVEWGPQAFAQSDLGEPLQRLRDEGPERVRALLPARAAIMLQVPEDAHCRIRDRVAELFDDYLDQLDTTVNARQADTADYWGL